MCGIVGQITFSNRAVGEDGATMLRLLIPMMERRGPDDKGEWTDGYSTLGFRRLAILDLSDKAHQPMLTPDGRYALVYNGEVYNFREVRRELELEGARFRSTGDTEVVLRALAHWGNSAPLNRAAVRGMFDQNLARQGNYGWLLWVLLSLVLWERRHRPAP